MRSYTDSEREPLSGEERFRLLVESVRDYAIFMLDTDGRVATWNVGAERIKGYAAHEIIGQHFSKFYPAEDIRDGKPPRELEGAARDGRFEDEGWRLRKDGTRFWANVVITALRDENGRLVGFAKVTRDLTERRRAEDERVELAKEKAAHDAERAARQQAERLQVELETTLRSIGDAVITTDARGRITMMNPVAESLTGWSEADASGRPLGDVFRIVNEHTRATVDSPVDRVLERGVVVGLANHTLLLSREGREIPIDDSGAPIRLDGGAIDGVVLVFRDVSERKDEESRRAFLAEATAALAESLDYEKTIAKVARLVVPTWADWCAVDIVQPQSRTPRRLAVVHVEPEKVKFARELEARYPPNPDATTGLPNVLRTGRAELHPIITDEFLVQTCIDAEELRLTRELGQRSAMVVPLIARGRVIGGVTFVFANSRRSYTEGDLAFGNDLAHRCALAIDNARLFGSEQEARRNADVANRAKDEFLAVVSHELRTPLNSILGWAKMMARGRELDSIRTDRAIETIERNAVAMAQLVDDLLDMSRVISGKMHLDVQHVELSRVIEAALDSIKPAADAKGIAVAPVIDTVVPAILGDATRLQQIVWNLLSNAVKFTPRGGRVDVVLRQIDSSAEICVADNGKGIATPFLPHVFDPFRQEDASSKRSRGGLGLGLAITRQLVELHGGRIEARSDGEGRGASFSVILPIAAVQRSSPAPQRNRRRSPSQHAVECPPQLHGLHVLVVDDEEDARVLVGNIFEECGCVVARAGNADEALAAIARDVPDLLLSDIGLPERDGFDLIRAVRSLPRDRGGDVPAAALTAYTRAEDRREMLNAGFSMHIAKPVDPDELVAVAASLTRFARSRA
ncbi:MAG TPA: PAS domain S-box protein [Polyangiaceae bacterium]|jgi:PAS domain S-box-containing protein